MKVIVNADDLGYSTHRDSGIFICFQSGTISSASLLVNGPSAPAAVRQALSVGLCLGLHLNLTEGQPVSGNVPSLVDDNGQMYYKHLFWQMEYNIEEICRETIAQLELFRTLTGHYPLHCDSHQHVHIIPAIADAIAPIFHQYGVTSVRIPDEDVSDDTWLPREQSSRYKQRYATAVKARIIYYRCGIVAPACFRGLSVGGALMSAPRLEAALSDAFGVVEIMAHPGLIGQQQDVLFNDCFDISKDREKEVKELDYFRNVELYDWSIMKNNI